MKNKVILVVLMAMSLIGLAMADSSVVISPVVIKSDSWRSGLQFNVANTEKFNLPLSVNFMVLSNAEKEKGRELYQQPFLGLNAGLSLYKNNNTNFMLIGGWSGNFNNLRHVSEGEWGVGASLSIKF